MQAAVHYTDADIQLHKRLMTDYHFAARHTLKIKHKDPISHPGLIPLEFKNAQLRLHNMVEYQMRTKGRVRLAIVKPRQVGWSTYILGRGLFRATRTPGFNVFLLTHNKDATGKFLDRVKLMVKNSPPSITPGREVENRNELLFDNLSQYVIGTAGSPDAARSDFTHFFHGSEITSWEYAEDLMTAIFPLISRALGTEAYLETSSKGQGDYWHNFILDIVAGKSEFDLFFDPWFNDPDYCVADWEIPEGWQPDDEGRELGVRYNLSLGQLRWRELMIVQLRSLWRFKQEYPAFWQESFQSAGTSLLNPDAVRRAQNNKLFTLNPYAPVIIGCDPGGEGENADRTAWCVRKGDRIIEVIHDHRLSAPEIARRSAALILKYNAAKMFIDKALGAAVAAILREMPGFGNKCTVVDFAESPLDEQYLNKRAEMADLFCQWLGDGSLVSLPTAEACPELYADLVCVPALVSPRDSNKLQLIAKDKIRKEYGRSPDLFDSCKLTFAFPVPADFGSSMLFPPNMQQQGRYKTDLTVAANFG